MINVLSAILAVIAPVAAEVISYDAVFEMSGAASGTLTVSKTVQVNNAAGEVAAKVHLYSDYFCSIASFSGTVTSASGYKSNIKKSNLVTFAPFDSYGTQTCIHSYVPSAPFPYTVHYQWVLSFSKGFFSFPDFTPVVSTNTSLRKANYTLSVMPGTEIRTFSNIGEPVVTKGRKDVYKWEVDSFAGVDGEMFLPDAEQLLPMVKAAPVEFKYGSFQGGQDSWNSLGDAFSRLVSLADGIGDDAVKQAEALTAGCNDTASKVKALYAYLRKKTRYVSISFGIGGYKPHDAKTVDRTGFGDCKDLSNYLKNLLRAAGVESFYCMVNTDEKDVDGAIASATAFNHAILAVPVENDTLYLECTNTDFPPGYRHRGIAGHQILLLDGQHSRLVRAREYNEGENSRLCEYRIPVSGNPQKVKLSCSRQLKGVFVEPYLGFNRMESRDKAEIMSSGMKFPLDNPSVTAISDNFDCFPSGDAVPQLHLEYSAECSSLLRTRGDMLFAAGTLSNDFIFNLPLDRKNDIFISGNRTYGEIIHFESNGFAASGLPDKCRLECPQASFEQDVCVSEGVVTVSRSLTLRKGTYPKEDYEQFRTFLEKVTGISAAPVVFNK